MPATESLIDAEFYRLIHRLILAAGPSGRKNRRLSDRRPFCGEHHIAPLSGDEFPGDAAFIPVRCRDLSRSGFSFFLPSRPDFTRLVAAFDCGDETLFVGAKVVHCQDVVIDELGAVEYLGGSRQRCRPGSQMAGSGTPMVVVGCQFLERLQEPARRKKGRS